MLLCFSGSCRSVYCYIVYHNFSPILSYTDNPARYPVDQAICKLNPPVTASTSIISPAKYRFLIIFDSMVLLSISLTFMPPCVIIASLKPLNPVSVNSNLLIVLRRFFLSSLVISFTFLSDAIRDLLIITGIKDFGNNLSRELAKFLLIFSSKSLLILSSRVCSSRAGFKSIISFNSFFLIMSLT